MGIRAPSGATSAIVTCHPNSGGRTKVITYFKLSPHTSLAPTGAGGRSNLVFDG